ncbi:spore cortex biosynthesis protein YabQ [Anaerosalibacter sp. Marseille-P3206]|uniref:spore cortex biosynthesis protein YabQ n=1 Tax=Anaerosalibacter sp. Marseille-P3206 TaxID=1871005 RepID=UPI000985BC64|nr:spore cortex biosynthesis protein YabQ [Anaerosalibacter sp. Marseille-P3206]
MDNSIKVQLYIFLTLFYGGLIIGLLFDIYKAFRYFIKPNKLKTFIGDLLFWIMVVAITFYILIKSSFGELRGYLFVGLCLGVFLYIKILSKIIYPLCIKILKFIFIILERLYKILLLPFSFLKTILRPFINKNKKVKQACKQGIKNMKKNLKLISTKK